MTDRRDDDFRIRPSAPKNRGQSFVSKVLKQAGKASSGKSAVRRPGGSSKSAGSGQRPGSRLGRGHTAARFAGEAHVHVAACDHQDAAAQSAPSQPAVACQAPALYRARWCGPRWRVGPSLRAADRCRRPRCVQGTLRRRPASLPLHPFARRWRGAGRPAHLYPAPHGSHGGRPWHGPRLGGRQSLEHRQPAHAHRRARARRHRQRPHHRGRLHRRWVPPSRRRTGDRMAGPAHRAGDPADLAARGGSGAVDEPGSHLEARGRRRWHGACRTAQRTPTATPASAADRQVAAFAAPGPGRRGPARHVDRPQRCGKDPARPGRARRHHPHHAAGHARRAARTGGVRAWGRWPNHPRPRGREGAGRRTARPGLSGHRRRGRHGPLRCAQRPRRAGELSDRRCGGGKEIG